METRIVLASLALATAAVGYPAVQEKPKPAPHPPAAAARPARQSPAPEAPYPDLVQERPGLMARAAVGADSATAVALAGATGATVRSRRLVERETRLLYVIVLEPKTGGKKEVMVDAMTGAVVPVGRPDPPA